MYCGRWKYQVITLHKCKQCQIRACIVGDFTVRACASADETLGCIGTVLEEKCRIKQLESIALHVVHYPFFTA